MRKTKLDETYIFKISIKMPFFAVLVSIEPGRSLLQFVTTLFDKRFDDLPTFIDRFFNCA